MEYKGYSHWLEEDDYKKALFQVRTQLTAIWNYTQCYGLQMEFDGAISQSMMVVEQFGKRIRGKDSMIKVLDNPSVRPTE